MTAAVPGFFVLMSLIVALGAQNVFVLRQGVRREHVGLVVAICAGSDALLILAGVAGLDRLESALPWIEGVARWGGAAFLLGYALIAFRRALGPGDALDPRQRALEAVEAGHAR
ncbi:MAG: amino acid transporter, partial [Actinomycetales bacterium]